MRRLSIATMLFLAACTPEAPQITTALVARPAPDDPTPSGINYICEGRREVAVVYARNRASVTYGGKTWRMEYQVAEQGFRYFDPSHEWLGRDDLVSLRENSTRTPLAFNCRPTGRTSFSAART